MEEVVEEQKVETAEDKKKRFLGKWQAVINEDVE